MKVTLARSIDFDTEHHIDDPFGSIRQRLVGSPSPIDQIALVVPRNEQIVSIISMELTPPPPTNDHVVSVAAIDPVFARPIEQPIVSRPAIQHVISNPSLQRIVPGIPADK